LEYRLGVSRRPYIRVLGRGCDADRQASEDPHHIARL
jgi:hypothetical protein